MVTLRKYLYGPWRESTSAAELPSRWRDLALHVTGAIEQYLLAAPPDADLRVRFQSVKASFESLPADADLLPAAEQFSAVLRTFRERADQTARAQSHDLYRILTTLNEALLLLAAGSTRTVGRLKQLEVSLERATTLNDIAALKSQLSEILTFVREDARKEAAESLRDRAQIAQQIHQVRGGSLWLRAELPGRKEAIAQMGRLSQQLSGSSVSPESVPCAVVVFVLGRIREIVKRYGDSAADELIAELLHRRIQFPDSDPQAFRWSPDVVTICLSCPEGLDRLNAFIEPQVEAPFEHRVFLGARVAVLRVALQWVVLPVSEPLVSLVEQIDRFAGEHA
jgi:hypothetical protein